MALSFLTSLMMAEPSHLEPLNGATPLTSTQDISCFSSTSACFLTVHANAMS
jgi:hypothetical protein